MGSKRGKNINLVNKCILRQVIKYGFHCCISSSSVVLYIEHREGSAVLERSVLDTACQKLSPVRLEILADICHCDIWLLCLAIYCAARKI